MADEKQENKKASKEQAKKAPDVSEQGSGVPNVKRQKSTWKGKEWYEIVSPKLFGEKVLTETPASDTEQLVGRMVTVNAATLTGNPSKYCFKMFFRVTEISGRRALCDFAGHECSRDFISRMVRRRSRRIDTRDTVTLSDGKRVVVKVIATTIRPTKTSIHSEISKKLSALVVGTVGKMDADTLVKDMLSGNLQNVIRKDASRVYPLREVEIHKTEILK